MTCQAGGQASPLPSLDSQSHTLTHREGGDICGALWCSGSFPYVLSALPPPRELSERPEGGTKPRQDPASTVGGWIEAALGPSPKSGDLCLGIINRPPRDLNCVWGGWGKDLS